MTSLEQQLDKFDKVKLKTVILNVVKANPELEGKVLEAIEEERKRIRGTASARPTTPVRPASGKSGVTPQKPTPKVSAPKPKPTNPSATTTARTPAKTPSRSDRSITATVSSHQMKRVRVLKSGDLAIKPDPQLITVKRQWNQFLDDCTSRLKLTTPAQKVFTEDGQELKDVDSLQHNQLLIVSATQRFVRPANLPNGSASQAPPTPRPTTTRPEEIVEEVIEYVEVSEGEEGEEVVYEEVQA